MKERTNKHEARLDRHETRLDKTDGKLENTIEHFQRRMDEMQFTSSSEVLYDFMEVNRRRYNASDNFTYWK